MKIFIGRVISTKRLKTATVTVENIVIHPLYKKRFRRLRKYSVHDDKGVKVGDTVKFITTRPYSKTVRWAITEIVENKNKKKVPVR
ncbi:MAG: 30S ribosomal protein S17 [Patescibacteria group bacterium]